MGENEKNESERPYFDASDFSASGDITGTAVFTGPVGEDVIKELSKPSDADKGITIEVPFKRLVDLEVKAHKCDLLVQSLLNGSRYDEDAGLTLGYDAGKAVQTLFPEMVSRHVVAESLLSVMEKACTKKSELDSD